MNAMCEPKSAEGRVECILRADDRRRWEARLAEASRQVSDHDALMAEVARACAAALARPEVGGWLLDVETAAGGRSDPAIVFDEGGRAA